MALAKASLGFALISRKSLVRRHPKRSSPSSRILPSPGLLWTPRWGRNLWRPVVRFAVEERSGKFRVIDNGRSGSHISCTSSSERIHTSSNLGSLAIARRMAAVCATPLHGDLEIAQGSEDMEKAFRQVPLQGTLLRFAVIALWSPLLSTWV